MKSELAKIGITVNINVITADQWYTKVYKNHDFAATLQEHVNDRDMVWYGDPGFYWGYDNPQVTAWVKDAERSDTADGQVALLKKVNEQIAADAASDWLYLYPQVVVASSSLSSYPVNGLNSQVYRVRHQEERHDGLTPARSGSGGSRGPEPPSLLAPHRSVHRL